MTTPEKRKLKMLLVMPVFVLLFSALGFYALGGGRTAMPEQMAAGKGINTSLPGAHLQKGASPDKMGLYDRAQKDSAMARSHSAAGAFAALGWDTAAIHRQTGVIATNSPAASEAKIKEKLAEINRQINQRQSVNNPPVTAYNNPQSAQLERLEQLLKQKQQTTAPDPQMAQLNNMLEKIQQIQNPGLVREQLKKEAGNSKPDSAFKAMSALIDGNQRVLNGGAVRLKLADSVVIGGVHYPKGQSLSGLCTITNQRLLLEIRNIRVGTAIIPVNLTVFSLDGMPGIPAPEAEIGEAAGQGVNDALGGMSFLPMDNSLGTQAATAGISAAKGLLGKKARRIRVKLHGGQVVLLRINKS